MNKTTKGALAAGAAGALLLGGAGSLAYWNATADVAGGAINSGKLTLEDTTTGTCADADWILDDAEEPAGAVFDPAADTLVPGDVLTKECTYTIGAEGTHLRADLSTSGGEASGDLSSALDVSSTFTVDGAAATSVTEADDGSELAATISVTFDPASDNSTQEKDATLSDYVVTLTQAHD